MLSCRGMRDGLDGIRAALATIPEGELTALQATADESPAPRAGWPHHYVVPLCCSVTREECA